METDTDGIPLFQNADIWGYVQVAAVLVIIMALVTVLQTAVSSLSEKKLTKSLDSGTKRAIMLGKILNKKSRFCVAAQVINSLILLVIGMCAGVYLINAQEFVSANIIPAALVLAAFSAMVILIGVLIPEKLVYKKNEKLALKIAYPIRFVQILFTPLAIIMEGIAGFVAGIFNPNLKNKEEEVTEEEIRLMVDEGEEKGYIPETEKKMINNIFQFNDTPVNKIMTHRTDMVALSVDTPLERISEIILEEGYTRLPVYEGTLDNIIGILHAKAIVGLITKGDKTGFDINDHLIKPYFIPRSKKADELFDEMQKNKIHMAIVVDEYGGTSGIITMEDLIESILGSIQDEYDNEEAETVALGDDTYIAEGSADFLSVCETLGIEITEDDDETVDYESLGGFVTGMIDKIPANGDSFVFENFVFEVADADDKKINKISIKKLITSEQEQE